MIVDRPRARVEATSDTSCGYNFPSRGRRDNSGRMPKSIPVGMSPWGHATRCRPITSICRAGTAFGDRREPHIRDSRLQASIRQLNAAVGNASSQVKCPKGQYLQPYRICDIRCAANIRGRELPASRVAQDCRQANGHVGTGASLEPTSSLNASSLHT
jgi:hypothetical protein